MIVVVVVVVVVFVDFVVSISSFKFSRKRGRNDALRK